MIAFSINSQNIKSPSVFDTELYTLTESTRIANGDMSMDFVANKRKFNLTYRAIKSSELNVIIAQLWGNLPTSHNCFHTFVFPTETGYDTATVYAGAIPKKLHRADGSNWTYKDITFSLIER